MQTTDVLNWLERENAQWEALLAEVGLARMEQPGVNGDWSMTELVAHLSGWNIWHVAARLEAALHGEPEPSAPWPPQFQGDDDAINAWIVEAYRGRSAADVLAETRRIYQQILAAIARLPDDARCELVPPDHRFMWVGNTRFQPGEFFDHFHEDHEANVRAWLARNPLV